MSEIAIYDAADLDSDGWRQLQSVQRQAFIPHTLRRSETEIDILVDWDDPARFYASHVDPNFEVGQRFNANQSYTKPRVAVATEDGQPIGFAYSAHNVSGATELERRLKRLSIVKNYLWLREVAVGPEFQDYGVATKLGRALLKDAIPFQPVSAYVWPGEIGFLQSRLEDLDFTATGEQKVNLFGEGILPVRQVRMEAKSVRSVLKRMHS